jgi:nucleoside-diphosphate-sugar epimerase
MRVVITGAAGFIGHALASALLDASQLANQTNSAQAITELVLVDRVPVDNSLKSRAGITIITKTGDLADSAFIDELMNEGQVQCIFHLAASLTLDAEDHEEQAYLVNVEATRRMIAKASRSTRFIFASSIAVFGGDIPDVVTDAVRAMPETTYGTHKAIVELVLADASRKGLIDARSLRLPIVLIRPGATAPTISDRIAAIVREPLSGRDVVCGITADTRIPVASAQAVARALIQLQKVPESQLPQSRVMNLPSLTVSVAAMEAATIRMAGKRTLGRVRYEADNNLQQILDGWPTVFTSTAASNLGICSDGSFDDIIKNYLADIH